MFTFLGISAPSQALTAMVKGLQEADADPTREIDMNTFGEMRYEMCYGCAATNTLFHLSGVDPVAWNLEWINDPDDSRFTANVWEKITKEDQVILSAFELVMDEARKGSVVPLAAFFNVPYSEYDTWPEPNWRLLNSTWHTQLDKVLDYANMLKDKGY